MISYREYILGCPEMGLLSLEKILRIPCIGNMIMDQCKGNLMNHHTLPWLFVPMYCMCMFKTENALSQSRRFHC